MYPKGSFFGLILIAVFILAVTLPSGILAQVNWKMTHKMPPDSAEGKAFQRFSDLVKEKSTGKMTVKIFPAEQLGKTEATLEMLENGTIQVYPEGETYLQKYVDELKYTNAPFLFENRDHYARFINSPRVKGWTEKVRKERNILIVGNVADFVRGPYPGDGRQKADHLADGCQRLEAPSPHRRAEYFGLARFGGKHDRSGLDRDL